MREQRAKQVQSKRVPVDVDDCSLPGTGYRADDRGAFGSDQVVTYVGYLNTNEFLLINNK
jgi:hypothetical protein